LLFAIFGIMFALAFFPSFPTMLCTTVLDVTEDCEGVGLIL